MEQPSYSRPPITEAVIQMRYVQQVDNSQYEKLVKKLNKYYSNVETLQSMQYKFQQGNTAPKAT